MIKTYAEALQFIHGRDRFKKKPTLTRMREFMALLGNPQDQLKMIHVAGTNGKGSTVAFLRDLFLAEGATVGTFTSPFITRFNERISVNGEPISDADLLADVQHIEPIVAQLDAQLGPEGPTEFEIDTALMFSYFAAHPVDVVVVEVGLGGKYDSTNIITPAVSVITTIGMDHMKILGDTIPKIAAQKAGIIKPGVPVVCGRLTPDALAVMDQTAAANDTQVRALDRDFRVTNRPEHEWGERFDYAWGDHRWRRLQIDLLGQYQIDNAATALTAYITYHQLMQTRVKIAEIRQGLQHTTWPGRFERLANEPLIAIDGAHNEPAMVEMAQLLRQHFSGHDIYIILAVLADKQYTQMVKTLMKVPQVHLVVTQFQGPGKRAAATPQELEDAVASHKHITMAPDWPTALKSVLASISADDLVLLTGSLYFISEVRQYFKGTDE
ncbi:bifunctional folylpolyglutamate synthase/dihydrofolate synthase [Levilactobacillus suantsaiihabitans]|uniref:Dihydrofolate synthase/folylpolyglutamate synthase n=1 Tax=Levilactobacillus suantsaiihabitans TaxID=2487722 RepID=A0A4Z0JAF4_9LACO|nr:folylpolyglutamate synthase/dihydrofolate synthase family protein [Levilactobacillus suantsaiihabitans]TGD19241.1 bifunctional folylpolyglutamate synthase/dihydrofolate synthase [Levilactobacillus suantsaiihabitans]